MASVMESIRDAAIVIAILDKDRNPNVWFELGLATALERPILIVLVDDAIELPVQAATFRTIGPVLTDKSIARAIQQVTRGKNFGQRAHARRTGSPLGSQADLLLRELNALPRSPAGGSRGADFEIWFDALLSHAQVPFERSFNVSEQGLPRSFAAVDFAVSADELAPNLGDPLPVELILGPSIRVLPSRRQTFEAYLSATDANTLLLVTLNDEASTLWSASSGDFLVCSAAVLLDAMRTQTFGVAVLTLRNGAVKRGREE